ncbi:MAG: hypothetical protein QOI80_408 [Solirubrobacteraceae bacterium]|jgi:hypothetical protein|nr:hypothetical protein [Solirubrobacteraceae bacterium]
MTSDRAKAYGRVVATIDELGPTKLQPDEVARVRTAADTLLFSEDFGDDFRAALTDAEALVQTLVESERWSEERAQQLFDDLAACGPVASAVR